LLLAFNAIITLDCYVFPRLYFGCREIGNDIKGADHGAHPTGDAFIAVDQHNIHIIVTAYGTGGTGCLARCRSTMAAFTGKR
jgi:hypothetical protein